MGHLFGTVQIRCGQGLRRAAISRTVRRWAGNSNNLWQQTWCFLTAQPNQSPLISWVRCECTAAVLSGFISLITLKASLSLSFPLLSQEHLVRTKLPPNPSAVFQSGSRVFNIWQLLRSPPTVPRWPVELRKSTGECFQLIPQHQNLCKGLYCCEACCSVSIPCGHPSEQKSHREADPFTPLLVAMEMNMHVTK